MGELGKGGVEAALVPLYHRDQQKGLPLVALCEARAEANWIRRSAGGRRPAATPVPDDRIKVGAPVVHDVQYRPSM